jgi:hypothetical protein
MPLIKKIFLPSGIEQNRENNPYARPVNLGRPDIDFLSNISRGLDAGLRQTTEKKELKDG